MKKETNMQDSKLIKEEKRAFAIKFGMSLEQFEKLPDGYKKLVIVSKNKIIFSPSEMKMLSCLISGDTNEQVGKRILQLAILRIDKPNIIHEYFGTWVGYLQKSFNVSIAHASQTFGRSLKPMSIGDIPVDIDEFLSHLSERANAVKSQSMSDRHRASLFKGTLKDINSKFQIVKSVQSKHNQKFM